MMTYTLYFANFNFIIRVYIRTIKLSIDIGSNIFHINKVYYLGYKEYSL